MNSNLIIYFLGSSSSSSSAIFIFRLTVRVWQKLHQRQATSTRWCSPLPCTGEGQSGLSIPRGSHPRAILPWTTLLIFYPCCPMRGHMWTALLNPIDRPLPLLFSLGHLFLVPPSTPNLFITHPTYRWFLSLCFSLSAVTFTPTLAL